MNGRFFLLGTILGLVFMGSRVSSLAAQQPTSSRAGGVLLIDEGRPNAVIVWDAKVTDDPFFKEFRPYVEEHLPWAIEQVTGARLNVVTEAPSDDAAAIMIGRSWLPAEARQRLEQNGRRFDSRILTHDGRRIYLAGASVRGDAGVISDFIHDVLAVHPYGPDPIQWQIPRQSTLAGTLQPGPAAQRPRLSAAGPGSDPVARSSRGLCPRTTGF